MYSLLFGMSPAAPILLAALGFKSKDEVGRFRDAYVQGGQICIYTRNGGVNRDCFNEEEVETGQDYPNENESKAACDCTGCAMTYKLPKHPLYLSDEDDEFDSTYATIRFKVPEGMEFLKALEIGTQDVPEEKWARCLAALSSKEEIPEEFKAGVERLKKTLMPVLTKLAEVVKDPDKGGDT